MNGPFANEYLKAACKEIETLEIMEAWEVVDITESMSVIKSTRDFELKQFHDGLTKTFKCQVYVCVNNQSYGINFFKTYAPVVQRVTVCLLIILEVLLDFK